MRAQRWVVSSSLAAILVACGYDFAPVDENVFTCTNADECKSGFVCGGQTLVDGQPASYCVEDGDEVYGLVVEADVSCGGTLTGLVLVGGDVTIDGAPTGTEGGDCVGAVNPAGQLDAICRVLASEVEVGDELAVTIELGDAPDDDDPLVTVSGRYTVAEGDGLRITGLVEDPADCP